MFELPPLSMLRALEATVRHGSMLYAARELHLTPGAVSRAIRELEAELGFALFRRSNRLVVPTPVARALADDLRGGLENLVAALGRARRGGRRVLPLVLSCEPTFLMRWLIPRLADLQAAVSDDEPGRELRLVSAGGAVPFAREGIDLAIRRADFPVPTEVRAEPFLPEHVGPVGRPELATGRPGAGSLAGVFLHTTSRPEAWKTWSTLTGTTLRPTRELHFEHFYLSLQAAVAGAGVAIGPLALVADDLAARVLTAPRGFVSDGTDYVLMAPRDAVDPVGFQRVLNWLRQATGMLVRTWGPSSDAYEGVEV